MRWELSVLALLDDLEQQAEGLQLRQRDQEVAERGRAEYAEVSLAARWHAAVGASVRTQLLGGLDLAGEVRRTGPDWVVLVDDRDHEWLFRQAAVLAVRGLPDRAVADEALGLLRRLSVRSLLRRAGERGGLVNVHGVDGSVTEALLVRTGRDFVEVRPSAGHPGTVLTPLNAVAAVQWRVEARL